MGLIYDVIRTEVFEETYFYLLHYDENLKDYLGHCTQKWSFYLSNL